MKHKTEVFRAFIQRYKDVFKQVWQVRDQLDPPDRSTDELAFLPAHLELIETPVSPLPRWTMRAIMLFALLALSWAIIGHMDIVATATGKTMTSGRTRIIQALEPSVVESIHVKDGQHVQAGQLLIKLDPTTADAEYQKAKEMLMTSILAQARYSALLISVETGKLASLQPIEGISEERIAAEEVVLAAQYQAFLTKINSQKSLIGQRKAEIITTERQITKLVQTSNIVNSQAADYKKLYEKNYMSKHEWLQKEHERVLQSNDLSIQRSRLDELRAALQAQQQGLDSMTAQFYSDIQERQKQSHESVVQYEHETRKNKQRQDILNLTAPVSGIVQQLAIHTVGGVVTEAQPVMAIVPDNESMEVEAMIENKDIGFIEIGQDVVVKIESFPYTRYGYIMGTVENISHDAIQDEKRGLIFPARVRLSQTYLIVDGVKVNLTAGMSVTAEIKTGTRRVIDYFLSPLKQHIREGLSER